jgi:hypothetical protein
MCCAVFKGDGNTKHVLKIQTTVELIPWRKFLEKLVAVELLKKFSMFYEI